MYSELMAVNLDGVSLEELIAFAMQARLIRAEYEHRNIEVPEKLDEKNRELGRELVRRTADAQAKLLRDLKAQRANLATPEEKRGKLDRQIEEMIGRMVGA